MLHSHIPFHRLSLDILPSPISIYLFISIYIPLYMELFENHSTTVIQLPNEVHLHGDFLFRQMNGGLHSALLGLRALRLTA